ncbi:MAG: hypothetical protein AAB779_03010 [Patescibacteria group bacterium]
MKKGKLIVLYGINNLGKTTQAKLLVDKINASGRVAEYIKVHIYDQAPDGPMVSDYLRGGNPYNLTPREFQLLAAVNKYHYQSSLKDKLDQGIIVVAEDYWATSVAWGTGSGVDKQFLIKLNEGLIKEDLAFLFDGERFLDSTEPGHRHEVDMDLTNRVRQVHLELGEEYGWKKINANDSVEAIHKLIWQHVLSVMPDLIGHPGAEAFNPGFPLSRE